MGTKSGTRAFLAALILAVLFLFNSCSSGGNSPVKSPQGASLGGALAELRVLETPPGADESVFDALKLELESKLTEIWGGADRIVARAPSGDSGRVTDLWYDSGTGHLTWSYVNLGDYDCSGEIGIPDITPIALNYLALTDDGVGDDDYERWIDGDGNGEIGIPDITAIALGYLSQVMEYLVLTCDTAEGEYVEIGRVSYPGAPSFPVTFDAPLPPGSMEFIAVQPVDFDNNAGERSNPCTLSGNLPPVAEIIPSADLGVAPFDVDFNATGSSDPDGVIAKYEWDYDGDGVWDEDTGTTPYGHYTYTAPGTFYATLKVTDDGGLIDTATATIEVTTDGNQPPTANIVATPDYGPLPLEVFLDANLSSDPDGVIVNYEWDFEGDGVWDANTDGEFSIYHTYDGAGEYYPAVRVTDDGGLTAVASCYVGVSVNEPPVAEFEWWTTGVAYEVEFDAWQSYDNDGEILLYEWDFDNDGIYDFSDPEQYATHNFGMVGEYECVLRVTDDRGATGIAAKFVYVPPPALDWFITNPAGPGDFKAPSLAEIGGSPAISYCDNATGTIYYVQATDTYGESWGTPSAVELEDAAGTALFEADGFPAIAYNASIADHLRYIRAANAEGTVWGSNILLDGSVGAGWSLNYADVAGMPALAYHTGSWQAVDFIRATDAQGGNWGTPFRISLDASQPNSLHMVAGLPAVTYIDKVNWNIMYRRALFDDGSGWESPVTVVSEGDQFDGCSMVTLGTTPNVPAIAYLDSTNKRLMFVRATDSTGSTWDAPQVIDDYAWPADVSLAIVDGVPCVAYFSYTPPWNAYLAFRYAADAAGTIWSDRHSLHDSYVLKVKLADVMGHPAIVWYDFVEPGMYYAVSLPAPPS